MTSLIDSNVVLTYVPRWPLVVNILSAITCLGLSAAYHNFGYASKKWYDMFSALDYGGICILIMGTTYPVLFYVYACEPTFTSRDF